MNTKPWYLSKTLWLQILTIGAAVASEAFPPAAIFLAAHPGAILTALAGANAILRLSTSDKVALTDDAPAASVPQQ